MLLRNILRRPIKCGARASASILQTASVDIMRTWRDPWPDDDEEEATHTHIQTCGSLTPDRFTSPSNKSGGGGGSKSATPRELEQCLAAKLIIWTLVAFVIELRLSSGGGRLAFD